MLSLLIYHCDTVNNAGKDLSKVAMTVGPFTNEAIATQWYKDFIDQKEYYGVICRNMIPSTQAIERIEKMVEKKF